MAHQQPEYRVTRAPFLKPAGGVGLAYKRSWQSIVKLP